VHAVRLHVVRETRSAADARHEDELLARNAELRHEALHRGQDRVVAAAGTPADLLVGLEVFRRQFQLGHWVFAFCAQFCTGDMAASLSGASCSLFSPSVTFRLALSTMYTGPLDRFFVAQIG